jgi:hypothetical protein
MPMQLRECGWPFNHVNSEYSDNHIVICFFKKEKENLNDIKLRMGGE